MLIMKKFMFCLPLREGCLVVSYLLVAEGFLEIFYIINYTKYCRRLQRLWYLQSQIDIVAGILLMAAAYNPDSLSYLLPVQIVVKLIGLIFELIFYLLLASEGELGVYAIVYSFSTVCDLTFSFLMIIMIIFKTCCFIFTLRQGCLIFGYFLIASGFFETVLMMITGAICDTAHKLWCVKNQINIISGVILLATSHNPENLAFLLPIQILVKLIGLIFELTSYLLLASIGALHALHIAGSFVSGSVTVYGLLVVFSLFQKLDQQLDW